MQIGEYCSVQRHAQFSGLVEARKNNTKRTYVGDRYIPLEYFYYIQEVEGDEVWLTAGMTAKGKRVQKAALSYKVPSIYLRPISEIIINRILEKAASFSRLADELQLGRRD
jgi:hypothetical protein